MSELKGKTALVTGASSGLGVDFAKELAQRGCDIILVARREDNLRRLAQELVSSYGVKADVQAADLGDAGARQRLYDTLKNSGQRVDILVNNAGFGVFGEFLETGWDRVNQMLQVDIVALTHLTRLFLPDMVARKSGYVLQVSSIGAFQPSPTYAAYSAAKSYVLSFSEALNFELRGSGVSCTAVCPGVTATEFIQTAGQKTTWYQRATMMTSPQVARIGVRSMLRRRYSVVTGWFNWLMAFSTRLTPRPILAAVAYQAMRN